MREMRSPTTRWAIVLFALAGPTNPAAWALGVSAFDDLMIADFGGVEFGGTEFGMFLATILLPCIVMAARLLSQLYTSRFTLFGLLRKTMGAWLLAAVTAPICVSVVLLFSLGGDDSIANLIVAATAIYVFGTFYGIIPYFALIVGLPCALMAFAASVLVTEPSSNGPTLTQTPHAI